MFVRYLLLLSICVFSHARNIKDSEVLLGLREELDDMQKALNEMALEIKDEGGDDVDRDYNDGNGNGGDASEDIYKINEKSQSQEKGVTNFQTDMILTPEQIAVLKYNQNHQGDAVKNSRSFWPATSTSGGSKRVTIPYVLDTGFVGKAVVQKAAAHIKEKVPCINFVDRTGKSGKEHHIKFINGRGCYSYVGKVPFRRGFQEISLKNRGCLSTGIAVHEMMHALGYFHEQSRPDRDTYITIKNENIPVAYRSQFRKANTDSQNTVYDFSSVMHYGAYAFSKNGKATIVRVDGGAPSTLGQRRGLSEIDARQLRMKYCGEAETTKPGPATTAPTPPAPGPTTPAVTTVPPDVEDKLWCNDAVASGFCRFCPVAKKYCSTQCVDKANTKRCQNWARDKSSQGGFSGYCVGKGVYSKYMQRNCAGSCKYKCV